MPSTPVAQLREEQEVKHCTIALIDALQRCGVEADVAANVASALVRNRPRFHTLHDQLQHARTFVAALTDRTATFMEVHGGGGSEAAHGCRRNLNVVGLDALDLRTCREDGTAWNVDLSSHRRDARKLIETKKPTWLIGSPACTAFTRLNAHWNFPKMEPILSSKKKDGVKHLHSMISLYRLQLRGGRRFLHEHPVAPSPGRTLGCKAS